MFKMKMLQDFWSFENLSKIKHINPVVLLLLTSSVMRVSGQGKHDMYWSKFSYDLEASVVYGLIV